MRGGGRRSPSGSGQPQEARCLTRRRGRTEEGPCGPPPSPTVADLIMRSFCVKKSDAALYFCTAGCKGRNAVHMEGAPQGHRPVQGSCHSLSQDAAANESTDGALRGKQRCQDRPAHGAAGHRSFAVGSRGTSGLGQSDGQPLPCLPLPRLVRRAPQQEEPHGLSAPTTLPGIRQRHERQ